jgi:putative oxidoreductase
MVTIFYDWLKAFADRLTWLAPLAVRIVVGSVFLWTGWQKLQILPRMTENFRGWGIPAPEIMTPFVSGVEFVCGIMILLGLLTRFAAVPLMIVMVVAIIAAKRGDIDSLVTLLGFEETSYFVMFAWLAIAGPGPVSLDRFILRASGREPASHGS